MDHGPTVKLGRDDAAEFKSKLGLQLFFVYGFIYAGFVFLNTIKPMLMAKSVFFGLNLAVVFGFGLIILAIIMGLVYNAVCTKKENEFSKTESEGK
ncbi:DUF485 domain-containing protein [bacterium]|nr:DUF485 domain-containing protein [bacterium]